MADSSTDGDLRQRVAKVIADVVAPLLGMDGAGVEVLAIEDGVVQVRLVGMGICCPGTVQAIILGIEEELRRHFPQVEYLEVLP